METRQDSRFRDLERAYPMKDMLLESEERRIEEFLATLAHELRNPMSCMQTESAMVKTMVPDEPKAHELKVMIRRPLNHLVRPVEDLSDAASILEGKVVLKTGRLDLRRVMIDAVDV